MKSGPHSPQLEEALAQNRRPNTAKNKKKIKKKKTAINYKAETFEAVIKLHWPLN